MQARFDDVVGGRSFRLTEPREQFVAADLAGVVAGFERAEAAATGGSWVAVAVTYEAAPAFDPALEVQPSDGPLAWFATFGSQVEVRAPEPIDPTDVTWASDTTEASHARAVAQIHRLIAAGVTYQTNLTHRLHGVIADPARLYAAMLHGQRPAYGAMIEVDDRTFVSASPELFFSLDGDHIATQPMKGTIGRGRWSEEDEGRRRDLADSDKDQAENLMIVDLLRNDLGRIAEFGSVSVESLFDIERYETVWQMTSSISARRRPDATLCDVFAALFPCGSVTGAPKASTMKVIADLEGSPRGVYCGAIGFVEPGGQRAVFSVPIRTATIAATGAAVFGTGGGITWDSQPDGEWREALVKANVLAAPRPSFDLLETMWIGPDGYRDLEAHLERMERSARYFGRPFDRKAILAALAPIVVTEPSVARLTLGATGNVGVTIRDLSPSAGPVRLAIDPVPIDVDDPFRFHKTTNRAAYDAAAQRFPDADDVVSVNGAGEAVETTIGNILVQSAGRWITPPLEAGCLPGVERAALLDGGLVAEAPVPLETLLAAERVEVVNSVRGRRAAVVDADMGPRTASARR